ncbi:hypothetical protein VT99_13502 [Candidatus Electrothrix marina]|uniref:Uncharacterized protein n=1 Tax=Candidatus Electrothrix marina TaxID=1859130 RepID=A0A3S4T6A8_9BACT|nr:hypothetical protein VT99_13502 [Candidatus Electrothrix marina]
MTTLPAAARQAEVPGATFRSKRILRCLLCLKGEGSSAALRHFYFLRFTDGAQTLIYFSLIARSPQGICANKKFHWTNSILFLFFIVK